MSDRGDCQPEVIERAGAALHAKFEQAIALHRNGKLAEAERIYREILQQQPRHAGAPHMLGVVAIDSGRLEQGAE